MADTVTVEGFTLLMSNDAADAFAKSRGMDYDPCPKDGRCEAATDDPVDLIKLKFEGGKLVTIEVSYTSGQPARTRAFGAALPIQKQSQLFGNPVWGSFSNDRTLAVVGNGDGSSVTAVAVGALKDQREADSIIATYGDGLAPPARA